MIHSNYFRSLLGALILSSGVNTNAQELVAMTYNLDWAGGSGDPKWNARLPLFVNTFRGSNADFINIQELSPDAHAQLRDSLPDYAQQNLGASSLTLYKKAKWKLDSTQNGKINFGDKRSGNWGRYIEIATNKGIYLYNVHFPWGNEFEAARVNDAKTVGTLIEGRTNKAEPVIAAGDYNAVEGSAPIKYLKGEITSPVNLNDPFREIVPTSMFDVGGRRHFILTSQKVRVNSVMKLFSGSESGNKPWSADLNFNVKDTAFIGLSKTRVDYTMTEGDLASLTPKIPTVVTLGNLGDGTLQTVLPTYFEDWFTLTQSGTGNAGQSLTFSVKDSVASYPPNRYKTDVNLNAEGAFPRNFGAVLLVLPKPEISIPGTIEAEYYKAGGEGVGYHDESASNMQGEFRTDDVDIEACFRGGYNVGMMDDKEWLVYDINVTKGGSYYFITAVSTASTSTPVYSILVDNANLTGNVNVPNTLGWQSWKDVVSGKYNLTAGKHTVKFLVTKGGFNFDYLIISETIPSRIQANRDLKYTDLHFHGLQSLEISLKNPSPIQISLYNLKGGLQWEQHVRGMAGKNQFNLPSSQGLGSGLYHAVVKVQGQMFSRTIVMKSKGLL